MARTAYPVDPLLLLQSRALGDPTRHAIFARIRDAARPVGVAELTELFRLNHNAIRQHLAKLCEASLVIEERDRPSGPGRPRLRYRPMPGAIERWGGTGPFEALSTMLLELLRGDGDARDVGRRAGRRLAVEYGPDADTVEILDAVGRRLGFEPQVYNTSSGIDVVLGRCPFVGPATVAPEIVCELHRGIAEGVADASADGSSVTDLVVGPPERAGCRIRVAMETEGGIS
ncbi:MAG: helix-turn-helix domain-containing protein [Microthrixaceae bacterium]